MKTKEEQEKQEIINSYNTGVNPFPEYDDRVRNMNIALESILFELDMLKYRKRVGDKYVINDIEVLECNTNPFVLVNGEPEYFQRPLVWTLEQKQLLVESIYQNIDCGKVLIRKHSWQELEQSKQTVLAFKDLIDGKQRLTTIAQFVNNEFVDLQGNYYRDFSTSAQNKFLNHQLISYAELPENTTDEQVLRQFLKLNVTGVPQSKEHIDFVKSLYEKVKK